MNEMTTLTTYQAVVLQSRAQRVIKEHLASLLREHGITMMQWSIIGLIADAGKEGVRISDLARKLDTSLAFITTSVNVLEAKGLVRREGHAKDNRAKLVRLSGDFAPNIVKIEAGLSRQQQAEIYSRLNVKDLDTYFKVLQQIAQLT